MAPVTTQVRRSATHKRAAGDVLRDLISAISRHDRETADHSVRTAGYAFDIALALGMSPVARRRVHWAALMHDIGKIGVPARMLRKRSALSADESVTMRLHPILGASILAGFAAAIDIVPIVMHHHEHWDGGGYPAGLKGTQIPVESRIILVADAMDAMTAKRTYRPPRPFAQALGEIERLAGAQFDPVAAGAAVEAGRRGLLEARTA